MGTHRTKFPSATEHGIAHDGTLTDTEHLYIRSMGKLLRITAIYTDNQLANDHCLSTNDAVVAVLKGGLILLADKGDRGTTAARIGEEV